VFLGDRVMRNLLFILIFLTSTVQAAAPTAEPARLTGDILGEVLICPQLGVDRVIVHIPGRSYAAHTALSGDFELNFVPPGTYNLIFEAKGNIVGSLSGITVIGKQQTLLGQIPVCIEDDSDGDGFGVANDCNDMNADIHPDAIEVCNLIDDNCDGYIDEGFPETTYYLDSDSDMSGDQNQSIVACLLPDGYVENSDDCNDEDANIHPGATEVCNGIDDNCNALVDQAEVPNNIMCPLGPNVSTTICISSCQVNMCEEGFEDCDSLFDNGCECSP